METTRQNKISRLIQKELSEIFLLQTKAMNGVLVSVSAVRIESGYEYSACLPQRVPFREESGNSKEHQ